MLNELNEKSSFNKKCNVDFTFPRSFSFSTAFSRSSKRSSSSSNDIFVGLKRYFGMEYFLFLGPNTVEEYAIYTNLKI